MAGHNDRFRQGTPVVLLGARGRAGIMHREVYERLGIRVYGVDVAEHPLQHWEHRLPWREAVVDVCTPSGEHASAMRWAYERGARRFLVGNPAARSLGEWRSVLSELGASRVFGVQNYLFSRAFQAARAALPDVHRITSSFHRLRGHGQEHGTDRFGRPHHVVAREMPQQFAMALSVCPDFEVTGMTEQAFGCRGRREDAAVACSVDLVGRGTTAVLSSNMRAATQRWIRLESADGLYAHSDFLVTNGFSRAYKGDGRGKVALLFAGEDDMLRACLSAAVTAFSADEAVPRDLSAGLVTAVERCVDTVLCTVDGPAAERVLAA